MEYKFIDKINSPDDVKKIEEENIPELCEEIRSFLVDNVGRCGGHLASNLGIVELSVAMHRIFNSPDDHIIFDVGHQSYVHKMITGRMGEFENLRKTGGLSGFTSMKESKHDAFGAGHSSTSVSAALGYAEADRLRGRDSYTVAILGDGAYTGGMIHEALNNCDPELKLIIILNENGMSISVNKGRFASYLSRVRISKGYMSLKRGTKTVLEHIPLLGRPMQSFLNFIRKKIKNSFFASNYFEDLGLYYMGPIDGNNYKKVEDALEEAKQLGKCVILHVKTVKGKGYEPAERSPDGFHSIALSQEKELTFHDVFAEELIKHAEKDEEIVAVTAAMGMGTGLDAFGERFPKRYFDVGIAEEHALTFSAGLAASGLKPFADIYSTFLQRGYDSIVHDICLQNLPVKLVIDRASLSTSDGATHHGIFDVAFLSHIPNMRILAPADYEALRAAVDIAVAHDGPIAIRYPNSSEVACLSDRFKRIGDYGVRIDFSEDEIPEYIFITYGTLVKRVIAAEDILKKEGYSVGIILLEELKPYSSAAAVSPFISSARRVLFAEEGIKNGGAAMLFGARLSEMGVAAEGKYHIAAIDDNFASPANICELYDHLGLSPEKLAAKILSAED